MYALYTTLLIYTASLFFFNTSISQNEALFCKVIKASSKGDITSDASEN